METLSERLKPVSDDLVKHLALVLNNTRAYPPGHPFSKKILEETVNILKDVMKNEELNIVIFETALFLDELRIERDKIPALTGFMKSLQKVGVNSITIQPTFTEEDLEKFFRCMIVDKLTLQEKNGIENVVKSEGVKGIKVNAVEYGIIKGGQSGKKEKKISVSWDSFMELLNKPDSAINEINNSPETFAGAIMDGVESLDDLLKKFEKISETILSTYGESERVAFSKWLLDFVKVMGPKLKEKIKDKEGFDTWVAKLIRKKLETLSDEELVSVMRDRMVEDAKRYLPEDKKGIIEEIKEKMVEKGVEGVEEIKVDKSIQEEDRVVVAGEEHIRELEKEAKEGIHADEFTTIIHPFLKLLDEDSPEVRKSGIERLSDVITNLLAKEKISVVENFVNGLKERMLNEDNFDVYIEYTKALENIASAMRERGREDISELVRAAFSELISSQERRKRAIEALGKVGGKDALQTLLSALWETGSYQETRDAIVKMADTSIPMIMEIFMEAEDVNLRRKLKDILIHMEERIIPYIQPLLEDKRWFIRKEAGEMLAEIGTEKAVPLLKSLLDDPEFMVKKTALKSLKTLDSSEAKESIINSLRGASFELLKEGLSILSQMEGEEIDNFFVSLLDRSDIRAKVEFFKNIMTIIGKRKIQGAIEPLNNIIKEKGFLNRPKFSDDIRMAAVYALGKIGGEKAKDILASLTNDPSKGVRVSSQTALNKLSASG